MSGSKPTARPAAGGGEFLALEGASVRLGETIVFRGTNWTWRAGEHWGMLGLDGAGKSLLIELLLGRVPLADGDLRGPHSLGGQPACLSAELIAHVSPLTQRRLAVQESSFYQSRWHSGVGEGQRTVAQFLSQDAVEERNAFEVGARRGRRRAFLRRRAQHVRWLRIKPLWFISPTGRCARCCWFTRC
jgi:ABC-type transport system involved in cytochrome c biogenesis ATPase subunit